METKEPIETTAVSVRDPYPAARAEDFLPLLTVEQAVQRKTQINQFINRVLVEGAEPGEGDYGVMPGTKKKVLFKPGAEKLCSIFGLAPQYSEDKIIEDWTGEDHGGEPLFYYSYKCSLTRGGQFMGEAIGSANSWESKYRYRWVRADEVPAALARTVEDLEKLPKRGGERMIFEPDFAIEKRETGGKYGKPESYWDSFSDGITNGTAKPAEKKMGTRVFKGYQMLVNEVQYRIPNQDVADTINTLQKIAQKRSLVAAVLVVTNASDSFTQDLEDIDRPGTGAHGGFDGTPPTAEDKPKPEAKSGPRQTPTKPAARTGKPVPDAIAGIVERIERDASQFGPAAQMMEKALVDKFGSVEGLKRYDAVSDTFYAAYPNGTRDTAALRAVLIDLHEQLEKPVEAEVAK